ncbi:MAG TPA: DUF6285 domain-containing protein [Candidatus Limnocylindrales bacterium]|nr:DUF6285 domain-containing protein [Candidatus Limnocylindrales bacterium]
MQDKPSAVELLQALAAFLREEVAPRMEGGMRFKSIVGANVAGIVAREIRLGPAQDRAQLRRLVALLREPAAAAQSSGEEARGEDVRARVEELSFELCRRIEAGLADSGPWREEVIAHLRATVDEKLAVDNPKAREKR